MRGWAHRQHIVNNCSQFLSYVWLPVLLRTNSMPNDMLLNSWFLLSYPKDVLLTYLITYITTYFLFERAQTRNASNLWANILSCSPVKARFFFYGTMERLSMTGLPHEWSGCLVNCLHWLSEESFKKFGDRLNSFKKNVFTCLNDVRPNTYAQLPCQKLGQVNKCSPESSSVSST